MLEKKIKSFINRLLSTLVNCGVDAQDSVELVLKKQVLTLLPLIIGIAATVWGVIYLLFGHYLSASIPLSYALISILSLWNFSHSKNMEFLKTSQLILVLLLPFFLMWSLGGFAAGSFVMIWAFYAPLAALSYSKEEALPWFLLFGILTLISSVIDNTLIEHIAALPYVVINIFSALNIIAGFGGIFYVMSHYINERDNISKELLLFNHKLEEKVASAVSKEKETHKIILQQSKLASMGEMISMIAHQWRQPLSSISALSSALEVRIELGKYEQTEFKQTLLEISDLVQHLSHTIDDFRNFFKPDKEKNTFVITQSISNAIRIMESLLKGNNIAVETHFYANKEITSFENELIQVFVNILKNATDELIAQSISDPKIIITLSEDEDENIILSIEDNAGGVPDVIAENIFQPYFSTKSKNGTGLGLYMSKIILEDHCKAKFSFHNTENGACFTIAFPFNKHLEQI